ncbi:MAG TPA: glucoamylase family protein [Opitutaceae bacterium]|nr:glucoamylase family protein [Opitutaceae bacterium]
MEQADAHTGLVRDRARADASESPGKASIAACGFALSAWAIATERGWTDRATAVEHVRLALRFLAEKAPRKHGFFYHFMEMDTGARAWKCELSPIDTGLFFAGAIMAREYFSDAEITRLVNGLFNDVDWEWFLNDGQTLAMAWHDEEGFSRYRWDKYSEDMMLGFLGMGAVERPLPVGYWDAWSRMPVGTYAGFHFIEGPQLFIHQFTHAYVDFRGLRDAYADYYRNSVLASLAQRRFCSDLRNVFPSWGERLWGLTASDSATGYKAWGGPPRTEDANTLDGTIVPCAAAGSVAFVPNEAMTTLRYMRTAYGDRIWSRYGFVDAFNPETGWVNSDVIGIDLGVTLLQAENARSGLVWAVFMQAPEVQRALARAGFLSQRRDLPWADQARLRAIAAQAWKSIESAPVDADSLGLRLSSVLAAGSIGLIPEDEAVNRVDAMLKATRIPADDRALAQYSASLVTLRQAIPSLEPEATRRLAAIDWKKVPIESNLLGSNSRLAVFFQVATGARPPSAWTELRRVSEAEGHVHVMEPAQVRDQLMPGLWLDERYIVTGASASQLAYAIAIEKRKTSTVTFPFDVQSTALLLEHFPAEVAAGLKRANLPGGWMEQASPVDRTLLLLSLANLLAPDCLREWFQQDPLAVAGRAAIADFGQAAFGGENSLFARNELAVPTLAPPGRLALVVSSAMPRDKWSWIPVKGLEYKVSDADVRPGDPDLELRFALTWDKEALHFHADVLDTPPGFSAPAGRRSLELFINPKRNGLVWLSPDNFQFAFKPDGSAMEWFHNRPAAARIRATAHGYVVEADIKWTELGIVPRPGLMLDLTASVTAAGINEWDPALELSWRYYRRADDTFGLGTARLE